MRATLSINTSNRRLAWLVLLAIVAAVPASAQSSADIIKKIDALDAQQKRDDAYDQFCKSATDAAVQKRCKVLQADIRDAESNDRDYIKSQGIPLFNQGKYSNARQVFNGIASRSLSAERNKWLQRIDQMEKGIAAASNGRVDDAVNNLRPIANSGDPELATAKPTAKQALDKLEQTVASNARSKAGSDPSGARQLVADLKKLNPSNPAIGAVEQTLSASAKTPPPTPAAPPSSPIQTAQDLVRAIDLFYQGNYDNAEQAFSSFISNNGASTRQVALAHFYRGATLLAKNYRAGRTDASSARDDFQQARKTRGFNPPQKYVSPKILKAYNAA